MKRPFLLLACILAFVVGAATTASAQSAEISLSVHFVTTEIAPGVKLCEELGTGRTIAYEPDPILTLADAESVRLERQGADGPFTILLVLTEAGRSRLHVLSADNVGRRLAILVNGVAHSLPLVRQPLDIEVLPVGFYSSEAFARELADRLSGAVHR